MNPGILCAAGALSILLMGDACSDGMNADQQQSQQQNKMTQQANGSVGLPSITNFAEKRQLRDIMELRDKTPPTITYIADLSGHLHKLCDSIGYGIPGATQYTNPEQDTYYNSGSSVHTVLPQPDPNGLYSPAAEDATWILCLNPKTKRVAPLYSEPRVIVSQYPLDVK
jgi:hypothetical protein